MSVLLSDGFTGDLDTNIWTTDMARVGGSVTAGGGTARIRADTDAAPGPGVMAYSGFASRNRVFTPDLAGTNVFEITLLDYSHEGEFLNKYLTADGAPSDHEDPWSGNYSMGFCLAIGTFQGLVGSGPVSPAIPPEEITGRVVQIHFDWYSVAGLSYCLNRSVMAGDIGRYRVWGSDEDKAEWRRRKAIDCPVVTDPGNSVSLAVNHNPLGDNIGWGHRYGLRLTDDANTLSWSLDGKVMDAVDITGFFGSSPGCVADGAYVTIVGGASYARNVWAVADVRVCGCSAGRARSVAT